MDLKYCCVICATAMSKDFYVATLRMSASFTTGTLVRILKRDNLQLRFVQRCHSETHEFKTCT